MPKLGDLKVRLFTDGADKAQILDFLAQRVAKWWLPDDVLFVESLPLGGTGKVQKNELRQRHGAVFGGE